MVKAERSLADAAGIQPFSRETIASARATGGDALNVADMDALLRTEVAELILAHSPQDSHLAEAFRVPVTRRAAKQ
jgi:hypothetical protein